MRQDVYSGSLTIKGESHEDTLSAAQNYAVSLKELKRFEEAKSVLRKAMPVARRVLGEHHEFTLKMRWVYAQAIYHDTGATLDDLREAVTTLAETERTARRVLGAAHPTTAAIEDELQDAQAVLSARAEKEKLMKEVNVTEDVFNRITRFAVTPRQVSVLGTTVEATYGDLESTRKALEALPSGDA